MSKLKIIDKCSEENIMSERKLLSFYNHPFIVNMYFSFQDFDLLSRGDLLYHIAHDRTFTEAQTKFCLSNMILTLEYCIFLI